MEQMKAWIKLIEVDILNLIEDEVKNGLTRECEHDLHILLENRKHGMEMMKEMNAAGK